MCYKKFFLHWWFGVVVFKWKSNKWEWFLPLSYACFLDIEFFKKFYLIYISYFFICIWSSARTTNSLHCWAIFPPSIYWIFMSVSMYAMCSKVHFSKCFSDRLCQNLIIQIKITKVVLVFDLSLWTVEKQVDHVVTVTIVYNY